MRLHEELYFEINIEGRKSDINRLISVLLSGELDDFFDFSSDFIIYDDYFDEKGDSERTSISLSNEDYGIEISEFNPEKFLDAFSPVAEELFVNGRFFDVDDEEYSFVSDEGDPCYTNLRDIEYNDELDDEAMREDSFDDEEY